MGIPVIVFGKSGAGKSRSIKGFGEDEIYLINVLGKPLPFKGRFKFVSVTDSYEKIKSGLRKMPTKVAVIDDTTYLMTNKFMRGHSAGGSGSSVFDLYNDIADSFWNLMRFISNDLPNDVIVYLMMHEESNDYGDCKLKTVGKLLDSQVCIEGMTSIVLRAIGEKERHYFRTHTNGQDIAKAPEDMFESDEIPNDLKAVDTAIRQYYEMGNENKEETENEKH